MSAHHYPGFLIAIEGIDGSGKTTQAHMVQDKLQARKLTVIRTKEPTTGYWGQILRDSAVTGRLSLQEEVEGFIKDRQEHVAQVLNPELQAGHVVIVDRYYFSSMAYQGARGMDPDEIRRLNEAFSPEPDMLVVLDIAPEIALERIRTRDDRANHFENTGTLTTAREIFRNIKKPYFYLLDGTEWPLTLRDRIVAEFTRLYTERIAAGLASASEEQMKAKLNATLALLGGDPI
jgi:dTMP kinase